MILTGSFGVSTVLAIGLASYLMAHYRKRRSPYYVWWAGSFYGYGLTFIAQMVTVSHNWTMAWYQIYIVASASLVGMMSIGTSYLAFSGRWARTYAAVIGLLIMGLALTTVGSPPQITGESWQALNAGAGIGGMTRLVYIMLSAVGGSVVWVGALWSYWRSRRVYNLLIAGGVLVAGLAGTLASQGLGTVAFPLANIVGLLLIFWGYVKSRESRSRRDPKMNVPS